MASPVSNRSSSPDILFALLAPSSSKPAPAASAAPSAPPSAVPAASELPLSPNPAQQRFPQPAARRLSPGLSIRIKPDIDSLDSFVAALESLRQKLEKPTSEDIDFIEYAKGTGYEYLEPPKSSELPSNMDIGAFAASIIELKKRLRDSHSDGLDMQHAPSSGKFPCKLSFPVPSKDALSGQGQATASFSMSGTLGLLTFTSKETGSLSFNKTTIAPFQPPPVDKGKGKQRAATPTGDASDDALAASRENSRSPAPAGSRSPSPVAGPGTGEVTSVPNSYSEIKPLPYVEDVMNALPEEEKTAYGLYAVLNAATHSNKGNQKVEDAVRTYLETFNTQTPEEKHNTIKELRKKNSKIIHKAYVTQNQSAYTYLKNSNVSDLRSDFATIALEIQKEKSGNTQTSRERQKALANFTKLAYPPGPFLSDCIDALGSRNKKLIDAAFYVDIALSVKADMSPRSLLEGKNMDKIAGLIRDLRSDASSTIMKSVITKWRSIRHPLSIDQVLKDALAEKYPGKNSDRTIDCILTLPIYQVLNGLTDAQLIQKMRDESIFNNDFASLFASTTEQLVIAYGGLVRAIARSKAVEEHLTKLQATTEDPTGEAGDRTTATKTASQPIASAAKVTHPNKKQRLK